MAMSMSGLNGIEVRVRRTLLISKLKANQAAHRQIVIEAREGYVKKAYAALDERLEQLRKGTIVGLYFDLQIPVDMSEAYRTVLGMLEMATDEEIVLSASEYRKLVMDEWDWTDSFLASNSLYSGSASATMQKKMSS